MFPGFVSIYRDDKSRVHVYFFRGISDSSKPIYRTLDLSHIKEDYKFVEYSDGAIDYIFSNPFLTTVNCKLINILDGSTEFVRISIN